MGRRARFRFFTTAGERLGKASACSPKQRSFGCKLRVNFGRASTLVTQALLLVLSVLAAGQIASATTVAADVFYTQRQSVAKIPVIASERVQPRALAAVRSMAKGMLAHRPDLAVELSRRGYRIAVMARDEALLDLPEFRHWTKPARDDPRLTRCELKHYDARIGAKTDRQYWDARVRGIGGQVMVAAEENVLGLPLDRYRGETIFVHEFAHQILDAIRSRDPALFAQIAAAYDAAKGDGLWRDEYTMTTVDEYWAEGSQFWFDSNRLQVFDGRRILNHDDVAAYDPRLYHLLGQVYGRSHRLPRDPFWRHEARIPAGPPPQNTAEAC